MFKKTILIILLTFLFLFLANVAVFAKEDYKFQTEWEKVYQIKNVTEGGIMTKTQDGGYAILGSIRDTRWASSQRDTCLIKVDGKGEQQWVKTGIKGGRYIRQTDDGGFLITGGTANGTLLIKTDSTGNVLQEFSLDKNDSNPYWGIYAQPAPDGGFYIVGNRDYVMVVIKVDVTGKIEWEKKFDDYEAQSAAESLDGSFVVSGTVGELNPGIRPFFMKFDSAGEKLWEKYYQDFNNPVVQEIFTIETTDDNGYILGAFSADTIGYIVLIKLDVNGNIQWKKQPMAFQKLNTYSYWAWSVKQAPDGGYLISGESGKGIYCIKTDKTGDFLWLYTGDAGYGRSVEPIGENSFVIAGTKYLTTDQNSSGIYVGKVNVEKNSVKKLVKLKPSVKRVDIKPGTTKLVTLTAYFSNGTSIDVTNEAAWSTSNDAVATISAGNITASNLNYGSAVIKATYGGKQAAIPVSNAIKNIKADVKNVKLKPGTAKQIKLTATFADGTSGDVTSEALWTVDNSTLVTVVNGNITAATAKYGKTNITGTYGGKKVKIAFDNTIKLKASNSSVTLKPGQAKDVTLTVTYADGSKENVTSLAIWTMDNPAVAAVNLGNIKAVSNKSGKAKVTALFNGLTVEIKVTVAGK